MPKFALLIGVSNYHHEDVLKPLPSARKDVEEMQRILKHPKIGEFSEVRLIHDPNPLEMQEAIEVFFQRLLKDDMALLFFSGHSIQDERGRLYLATPITRKTDEGELLRSTLVPAGFVHDVMDISKPKQQVLILDCLFSGASSAHVTPPEARFLNLQSQLTAPRRIVLSSSNSVQYSYSEEPDLSTYTRFLIEGIETGDADQNNDGMVSVHELHDYISNKGQDRVPALHPDIVVPPQDGFDIKLTRAYVANPIRKYRHEVERYTQDGKVSPVGRAILERQRLWLELSPAEAHAIEDQVLHPYRQDIEQLQRYKEALISAMGAEYPLQEKTQNELADLQKILDLSDRQVAPIQAEINAQFAARAELKHRKLVQYEQEFLQIVQLEYPISDLTRDQLKQTQRSLGLREHDVAEVEHRILSQIHAQKIQFRQNLQRYQQELQQMAEEFPLDEAKRQHLRDLQQELNLRNMDVVPLEQQVVTELETQQQVHQAKIQQYEQAVRQALQDAMPMSATSLLDLDQLQQDLELDSSETRLIEETLIAQAEAEQTAYAEKLHTYQQQLLAYIAQGYPLSTDHQQQLEQLQQALQLRDADVNAIQQPILAHSEAEQNSYQRGLIQYEAEFTRAVSLEFPLSEVIREGLQHQHQRLGLNQDDVQHIEQRIIAQVRVKEEEVTRNRQQYEETFTEAVTVNYPLNDGDRFRLWELQRSLELRNEDIQQIEAPIIARITSPPIESAAESSSPAPHTTNAPEEHAPEAPEEAAAIAPTDTAIFPSVEPTTGSLDATVTEFVAIAATTPTASAAPEPSTAPDTPAASSPANIESDRALDYTNLETLLHAKRWKQADLETLELLLFAVGQKQDGWMSKMAIAQLPAQILKDLDQRWVNSSDGQFGFSVQRDIFTNLAKPDAVAFARQVGWWQKGGFFKYYRSLTFTSQAPKGHLPALWYWKIPTLESIKTGGTGGRGGCGRDPWMLSTMMQHLKDFL